MTDTPINAGDTCRLAAEPSSPEMAATMAVGDEIECSWRARGVAHQQRFLRAELVLVRTHQQVIDAEAASAAKAEAARIEEGV